MDTMSFYSTEKPPLKNRSFSYYEYIKVDILRRLSLSKTVPRLSTYVAPGLPGKHKTLLRSAASFGMVKTQISCAQPMFQTSTNQVAAQRRRERSPLHTSGLQDRAVLLVSFETQTQALDPEEKAYTVYTSALTRVYSISLGWEYISKSWMNLEDGEPLDDLNVPS